MSSLSVVHGEISMRVMDDIFYDLDMPIMRMGTGHAPIPFSPALEFPILGGCEKNLCQGKRDDKIGDAGMPGRIGGKIIG